MNKNSILKGILLMVVISTAGCSSFMWEGRAIHQYQKKVRQSDHSFLQEYDTIYVTIDKSNVINIFESKTDRQWLSKSTCETLNNSEIPIKLINQQLIPSWPKCIYEKPDDANGVLAIHLDQKLKFIKDEISITYKDMTTGDLKDQVDGIMMIGINDFSDYLVGDLSNRLLMANTPPKGTKEYKIWAKKVKASCNCLY